MIPTEDQEQTAVAKFLDLLGVAWCHVPNGGVRNKATAGRLKAHGVKSGVPDILIFTPPPMFPHSIGVAIELKRAKGGTLSPEQKAWLESLGKHGWIARRCNGFGEVFDLINSLGYKTTTEKKGETCGEKTKRINTEKPCSTSSTRMTTRPRVVGNDAQRGS